MTAQIDSTSPDDKRAWRSWALYDWANSAFATTVMAGFFPLFFKAYWANPNNPSETVSYTHLTLPTILLV